MRAIDEGGLALLAAATLLAFVGVARFVLSRFWPAPGVEHMFVEETSITGLERERAGQEQGHAGTVIARTRTHRVHYVHARSWIHLVAAVRVTGRDIARRLGLSASTVSQALNDKGSLNPETVGLVKRTAKELGYQPARRSRTAAGIEGSRVLVILSNTARDSRRTNLSGLDVRAIQGVETAVKERGATPVLVSESQLADDAPRSVSGAVVIGGYLSEATAAFLTTTGVPAVMIASPSSEPNISSVQVDVIEGVRRATSYLHELGHRRVALLNGPSATLASDHKLTGYLRALFDHGIAPNPSLILSLERDVTGSRAIVLEALNGALQGVTGVVCAYEELAIAALQAGREIGIRVPDDLSIIAYHDEGLAEVAVPPLTTIALPIELMARLAVSQLVTLVFDPDLVGTQLLVKAALRIRGSTAPAKA